MSNLTALGENQHFESENMMMFNVFLFFTMFIEFTRYSICVSAGPKKPGAHPLEIEIDAEKSVK